ncbi:uncharacterized protein L199_002734 [Kwoniella botswanensis]|uniref:uncharacterized protein n=1 Tax=Kwoniella botswanensis TaxID=1268659 RepID=UPI00315DA44E
MSSRNSRNGPTEVPSSNGRGTTATAYSANQTSTPAPDTWEFQAGTRRGMQNEDRELGDIQGDWIVHHRTDYSGTERIIEEPERSYDANTGTITHAGTTYTRGSILNDDYDERLLVYKTSLDEQMIPNGQDFMIRDISEYLTGTYNTGRYEYLMAKNTSIGKERWTKMTPPVWNERPL